MKPGEGSTSLVCRAPRCRCILTRKKKKKDDLNIMGVKKGTVTM